MDVVDWIAELIQSMATATLGIALIVHIRGEKKLK